MQKIQIRYRLLLMCALSGFVQADSLKPSRVKVLELTEDVVHPGSSFASEVLGVKGLEKLIISSTTGKSLILKKDTMWDLSHVFGKNTIIEFAGNARFVSEPGSQLHGTGGVLRFVDDARWIVGKE